LAGAQVALVARGAAVRLVSAAASSGVGAASLGSRGFNAAGLGGGARVGAGAVRSLGKDGSQAGEEEGEEVKLPINDLLVIIREMLSTLQGRESNRTDRFTNPPFLHQQPVQSTPIPPTPQINVATAKSYSQAQESPVEPNEPEVPDELCNDDRDPGVSDAIWNQLQANKRLMEEEEKRREESIRNLEKEKIDADARLNESKQLLERLKKQTATDDAEMARLKRQREQERLRAHAIKLEQAKRTAQLEMERKKKQEEARVQQKLREMGVCVAGFRWIKVGDGYRCAGGSHFISNDQLGI